MRAMCHRMLLCFALGLPGAVGLLGAVSLPGCGPRQDAPEVKTIAMLRLTDVDLETVKAFKAEMAQLGYAQGEQVRYVEVPPAQTPDKLEGLIRELLTHKPDVILVSSTPAMLSIKRMLGEIPAAIVFAPVNDPLASGIVADLKHPGGQITGVKLPHVDELRLAWLGQVVPSAHRIFLPYTASDKSAIASVERSRDAAHQLGLDLVEYPMLADEDASLAIAAIPADVHAMLIPPESHVESLFPQLLQAAQDRHLPVIAPGEMLVKRGATFSYGASKQDMGRRAAKMIDEILKGIPPGDLPVQTAESRLTINLVAANKIKLKIPDEALQQADMIIRE
jgi:putative ABC transport system substrate-binding protein